MIDATVTIGETRFYQNTYRCHVALVVEEEGGFSAVVLNLPGVGSCGETEQETLLNVCEAAQAVIESYLTDEQEIPWINDYKIPWCLKTKWINVQVGERNEQSR